MSIEICDVTKSYGSFEALKDLSFDIESGEIFSILGANGAGKTTLVHALCGLIGIDHGSISLHGFLLPDDQASAHSIVGMCPQEVAVWDHLTCEEQLNLVADLYDINPETAQKRITELLHTVGLLDRRGGRPTELSGGMKRLLNLILSLVHNPEVVVLDEPFTELDPYNRMVVRSMITEFSRNAGKTVIITSNDTHEIDAISDRIAVIDKGQLVAVATPDHLKSQCPIRDASLEQAFTNLLSVWRKR